MDINLLALDAGHARLKVGVFQAGELVYTTRVGHDRRADWPAVLAEAWGRFGGAGAEVAGACVDSTLRDDLARAAKGATGKPVEWVGDDLDLPIPVRTENPAKTGVDRVLNVAAAYEQLGKACVVVDAGSAVTVDLCDDRGAFVGGAIAPGASMQLRAMRDGTSSLPEVAFTRPDGNVGRSTDGAMLHGVYHGIRGLVKELAESYALELGTWPEVIATGGDAQALFGDWELVHAVSPDLTLYGVALAYAEHHIQHKT